jgi:hypothetical protein
LRAGEFLHSAGTSPGGSSRLIPMCMSPWPRPRPSPGSRGLGGDGGRRRC